MAPNHGKLVLHLAGPLQQISVSAVRLSSQLQSIVAYSTADSMMVQGLNDWKSSVTFRGDSQLSGQFNIVSGTLTIDGTLSMIDNPGNIALNGPGQVAIPLPPTTAAGLSISGSISSLILYAFSLIFSG